jgi:hypothetical protein
MNKLFLLTPSQLFRCTIHSTIQDSLVASPVDPALLSHLHKLPSVLQGPTHSSISAWTSPFTTPASFQSMPHPENTSNFLVSIPPTEGSCDHIHYSKPFVTKSSFSNRFKVTTNGEANYLGDQLPGLFSHHTIKRHMIN